MFKVSTNHKQELPMIAMFFLLDQEKIWNFKRISHTLTLFVSTNRSFRLVVSEKIFKFQTNWTQVFDGSR